MLSTSADGLTPHLRRVIAWQAQQEQLHAQAASDRQAPDQVQEVDFFARDAPSGGWEVRPLFVLCLPGRCNWWVLSPLVHC